MLDGAVRAPSTNTMRIVDFELAEPVPLDGQLVRRRSDAPMRDPTIRDVLNTMSPNHHAAALVLTSAKEDRVTVWVPLSNVRWWSARL